jgi:hypothetical protein
VLLSAGVSRGPPVAYPPPAQVAATSLFGGFYGGASGEERSTPRAGGTTSWPPMRENARIPWAPSALCLFREMFPLLGETKLENEMTPPIFEVPRKKTPCSVVGAAAK